MKNENIDDHWEDKSLGWNIIWERHETEERVDTEMRVLMVGY